MFLYFFHTICSQSLGEVLGQQFFNEIFRYSRNPVLDSHLRPINIEVMDILYHFLNGIGTKGSGSNEKLISYDAKTPPIDCFVFSRDVIDNLWSDVVRSSNKITSLDVFEGKCYSSS